MHTLRLAARRLLRSPGYALVAVTVLALGLGAATAIFSVVHAVLLSPLAYADSAALVQIRAQHPQQGYSPLAPATFGDLTARAKSFSAVAAQTYDYVNLTRSGPPALVTGVQATADYFRLFGVAPRHGRVWNADEARDGAGPVVVLGERLWQTQYGGRVDLIGQAIIIDDTPHTVLGVMPAAFEDPWGNAALWRPARIGGNTLQNRSSRTWSTFARLAPDVTLPAAQAELAALGRQLAQEHPQHYQGWTLAAADLLGLVVADYRQGLWVLVGAVGCVILITCANVAGLNIVRASARRKELAIRTALGASRRQLLTELLLESLLLAAAGGALGLLAGSWGVDLITSVLPGWLPRADEIAVRLPILLTLLGLTAATGLAFGLAPGFAAARADAQEALKDGRGSTGPAARRLRSGLVVAEIVLALVLLVGAGLFGRNLVQILNRASGFDTARVLSLTLLPTEKRYDTAEKRADFYRRVLAEVAAVPGVESAAFTQTSPFRWGIPITLFPVASTGDGADENQPQVYYDSVSTDYFRTIGNPIVAGRPFTDADVAGGKPVVIVSAATARRYFGEAPAVGRQLTNGGPNPVRFEIVGVASDILRDGLADQVPLQVYRPLAQRPTAFGTLMIRTALPPDSLAKSVQAAVWRVDPDIPAADIAPMARVAQGTIFRPRLYLALFALFSALALTLAGIGLYGLIAYSVAQRTREFGIRTALGASPAAIQNLILREGGRLVLAGLGLGLLGALATSHLIGQLLLADSTRDPLVFGGVTGLLAAVALAACLLPARRAARLNPLDALRRE